MQLTHGLHGAWRDGQVDGLQKLYCNRDLSFYRGRDESEQCGCGERVNVLQVVQWVVHEERQRPENTVPELRQYDRSRRLCESVWTASRIDFFQQAASLDEAILPDLPGLLSLNEGIDERTGALVEGSKMIIVGKGSDLKKIGFAGIEKCSNCKNFSLFWLCEYSQKLTAYFIPVVRYNRKLHYRCETCGQAYEVNVGMDEAAIRTTVVLPSRDDALAIWNAIDEKYAEAVHYTKGQDDETVGCSVSQVMTWTMGELRRAYRPEHVDYVGGRYAQFLADTDRPQ
jgi:hypothetical protein